MAQGFDQYLESSSRCCLRQYHRNREETLTPTQLLPMNAGKEKGDQHGVFLDSFEKWLILSIFTRNL